MLRLMVGKDYAALHDLSHGIRLTATEIKTAIREYGRTVRMPPELEDNQFDVLAISNTAPQQWSVNVDLWTHEEGRSDLTLSLTLIDTGTDKYDVEIDDIHVL
jgi:hypothetical protein